jgi:hypothetical protein
LVAAVLEEFDVWAEFAPQQAASVNPSSPIDAAGFALADVRADLMDHLQIRLSITLATHGVAS